jgi:hypothetical protein
VDAEARILTTDVGQRLLPEVAKTPAPRPADLGRWRKLTSPPEVAAVIRLAYCRARARAKFTRADRMWLDAVGLEQSTSETVAQYKARRFEGPLAVDLCAGIGGDSLALAERGTVVAIDRDHGMCRRLAWNAEVYEVADRVLPCQARAETFPIPDGAWIHIDPDRRGSPRHRARSLVDYEPGPEFLRGLSRGSPGGAIKLSPASDFASYFAGPGFEVELISLKGECKEATVWFGAAVTCHRRATRLPDDVTWTDRDGGSVKVGMVQIAAVSDYVYDPDPALLRSGLLDSFAAAHSLCRIAAHVDYLTSETLVATPFLTAFAVQSVHRLDLKQLKRLVAWEGLGPLEIKLRGLELVPETVRARLRPEGTRPATLILVGGTGPALAILAQRVVLPPQTC